MEEEGEDHRFLPPFTFSGILHHSATAILSRWKPLTSISFTLALPLSLTLLLDLDLFPCKPSIFTATAALFLLYKATHYLAVLHLSTHLTTSVLRTIASTSSPTSLRPLAMTLLCAHILLFSAKAASISAVSLAGILVGTGPTGLALLIAVSIAYITVLVLTGSTFVLACAVAAAESAGVAAARRRARKLLSGRDTTAAALFLAFWLALNVLEMVHVKAREVPVWWRLLCGCLTAAATAAVLVAAAVATAVAYVACKSAEEEERCFLGEYVLVKDPITTVRSIT